MSTYALYWNKIPSSINRQIGADLMPHNFGLIVMNVIGWLILAGTVLLLKNDSLAAVYVILTVFIACWAPWQQIARYVVPIVPLLLYALFRALREMRSAVVAFGLRWGRPLASGFTYICLASIVAQQAVSCVIALRHSRSETYQTAEGAFVGFSQLLYQDQDVALDQAVYWVRDRASPGDILAAAMPQWVYLKTGLKAVMPPLESDPIKAESLLDSVPVDYLIIEKNSRMGDFVLRYMLSVVHAFPNQWIPVYSNREGTVRVFKHQIFKPH